MTGCLVDTNIICELRRGKTSHPNVVAWHASVPPDQLHLTIITIAEIRKGIALLRKKEKKRAHQLTDWCNELVSAYTGLNRLLGIDAGVASAWGELMAIRTLPVLDGLLAATAQHYQLTLITRNEADFQGLPVTVFNPFNFQKSSTP